MILHYIRISLRNLSKYKTQTAISICAMAVSLTLMAIVTSIMLSIKPTPLLSQPYAHRVEQLTVNPISSEVSRENIELILGHSFKCVEEIHTVATGYFGINITADQADGKERSMTTYGRHKDKGYLKFLGLKSAYSGDKLGIFSDNDIVITDWLAKRLFEDENPIGRKVTIYNDAYIVKDVIERPSTYNNFISTDEHVNLFTDHIGGLSGQLYFILREDATRDELIKELRELLPDQEINLLNIKDTYDDTKTLTIRYCVILFLVLFVLMTFFNYLRQQTQLFRLREREIALRTSIGSMPSSLFLLFASEISIVMLLTLMLTLSLVYMISGILMTEYASTLELYDYSVASAVRLILISIFVLILIGIIATIITVRIIKRNQTGLALRMRPLSRHRLRNTGLIMQMAVSIVFLWITVLMTLSTGIIKDWYGIPDNIDKYKKCISLALAGFSPEEVNKIYDRISSSEYVQKVYPYTEMLMTLDENGLYPVESSFYEIHQMNNDNNDLVDFFNLKVDPLPGSKNTERYVLVSEGFKQMLIDKNLWNGKTVTLPYRYEGEYEVKGTFDKIPFIEAYRQNSVIVTDPLFIYESFGNRIILPKAGFENNAKNDIEAIIREMLPSRIDIKTENYFNKIASSYRNVRLLISIIDILSIISVITTIASVYAGVSLDTRRRRKEMALRKLNGAGRKVIAMIFLRVYITVIALAALIALPLGLIGIPKFNFYIFPGMGNQNILLAYVLALIFVIAVTTLTITWKIRDIIHADPIEYLKE